MGFMEADRERLGWTEAVKHMLETNAQGAERQQTREPFPTARSLRGPGWSWGAFSSNGPRLGTTRCSPAVLSREERRVTFRSCSNSTHTSSAFPDDSLGKILLHFFCSLLALHQILQARTYDLLCSSRGMVGGLGLFCDRLRFVGGVRIRPWK